MNDNVLIAIIGSSVALCGYVLGYLQTNRKEKIKFLLWKQELKAQLKSIAEKLDTHNKYAEKFGAIQKSINKIEKEQITTRKDIEFLREKYEKM